MSLEPRPILAALVSHAQVSGKYANGGPWIPMAGWLAVRDLIGQAHYRTLTAPWQAVIGQLHPDDAPPATTRGATS